MPLTALLNSAAGTCRHCRRKAGLVARTHRECPGRLRRRLAADGAHRRRRRPDAPVRREDPPAYAGRDRRPLLRRRRQRQRGLRGGLEAESGPLHGRRPSSPGRRRTCYASSATGWRWTPRAPTKGPTPRWERPPTTGSCSTPGCRRWRPTTPTPTCESWPQPLDLPAPPSGWTTGPAAVQDLVQAVLTGGSTACDIDEARRATEIGFALHASSAAGGARVGVPVVDRSMRIESYPWGNE